MIEVHPATVERFGDVEAILTPVRNPDAPTCWCLSYRISNPESSALPRGQDRAARLRRYAEEGTV